ncbi:DUF5074 domain-containing protein [Pedobacter steynii]|uniref:DUF5074 domain-containing protein n=1 Tax=Pedobacter steynii TaxID=430522 RepID=A0A1D7QNY0_9SPHI|nr:DUF5074 domain-containing protein [Pedobacter steynii]AOM80364.1 hypothetical protein BFS30_26270 [Pedobacter steynii]
MKMTNFKSVATAVFLSAALFSCKKDAPAEAELSQVTGKYEDGFFIINEGWFGHGTGSVSFFNAAGATLKDSIFQKENPGKGFEPGSSTVQFGTIFNKNLYVVSKINGPVVVADAKTMKEVGRIPASSEYDWRAFVGIDENDGLLSSSDGIYLVNLKTFKPAMRLLGTKGQVGDMLKTDKYVYTLSQSDGAVIYNISDYSVAKKIKGVSLGFARTPNGKVWYTGGKYLYQSDPQTLATDSVELPFTPSTTWFAWFSSPIIASSKENAVFIMKSPGFGGGKEIYKYVAGSKASLDKPFIITPDRQSFYKKNLGYYAKTDQIVTTTVQDGYGANYAVNNLYFYNAGTGQLNKTISYDKYHFPAMFVFH